jgi:hypothetical protein
VPADEKKLTLYLLLSHEKESFLQLWHHFFISNDDMSQHACRQKRVMKKQLFAVFWNNGRTGLTAEAKIGVHARWFIFKPKFQIWVYFGGPWNVKNVVMYPYFMTIWNIIRYNLWPSGKVCGHLVYFPRFGMFRKRKIWQPWSMLPSRDKVWKKIWQKTRGNILAASKLHK